MTEVFLLKNQNGDYLEKSGEWVNPAQSKTLFRTPHRDEAINQKVELAVKNAELRVQIATGKVSPEGKLLLKESDAPLEMPTSTAAPLDAIHAPEPTPPSESDLDVPAETELVAKTDLLAETTQDTQMNEVSAPIDDETMPSNAETAPDTTDDTPATGSLFDSPTATTSTPDDEPLSAEPSPLQQIPPADDSATMEANTTISDASPEESEQDSEAPKKEYPSLFPA